jgi:hypothetical protein
MRKHLRRVFVIIIVGTIILGFIHNGRSLRSVLEESSSNFSTIVYNNNQATNTATNASYFWEKEESTCFHLDHVCRSDKDGWFYAPAVSSDNSNNPKMKPYQPTATLLATIYDYIDMLEWNNLNDFNVDDRIQFHILHNSTHLYHKNNNNNDDECIYDSTPHHLIVQSAYNEMMGEFYVRTLLGINRWIRNDNNIIDSDDDIQIYIHFVEK